MGTMPKYRNALPQLSGDTFLTDGGLETTLIFTEGIDLPEFAAFLLLDNEEGRESLRKYFRPYLDIAMAYDTGFILESPTYRTSQSWGDKLGLSVEAIADFNRKSISFLEEVREEYKDAISNIVISGCIGPKGDGYNPQDMMTASEAETYHRVQIATFAQTQADLVSVFTVPYISEGLGIAQAAKTEQMPVVISFTVETDGKLPSGETLQQAVEQVDAETENSPAYYMINCAHPTHLVDTQAGEPWTKRIRAMRANASSKSHAELDESTELDTGNIPEFGPLHLKLIDQFDTLNIFGGCCGTDHRHVEEICKSLVSK